MTFPSLLNITEFYKFLIKVHYWKCTDPTVIVLNNTGLDTATNTSANNSIGFHGNNSEIKDAHNSTTWTESASSLFSAFKSLFASPVPKPPVDHVPQVSVPEVVDPCSDAVEYQYEGRLYPTIFVTHIILMFFTMLLCLVLTRVIRRCIKRGEKQKEPRTDKTEGLVDDDDEVEISAFKPKHCLNRSDLENPPSTHIEDLSCGIKSSLTMKNDRILLSYQNYTTLPSLINPKPRQVPVQSFLKHTTDYLFSMMDKLLLENSRSPSRSSPTRSISDLGINPTYSSLNPSPRRSLRRSGHRSRCSSPGIQEADDQSLDPLEKRAWEEYLQNIAMNNNVGFDFDVDLNMSISGGDSTRKLLQYYLNQGSIRIEQMQVANLIVNYGLYLMSKELNSFDAEAGLLFKGFRLVGSMKKGLKVSNAGQFDFLMELNATDFHVIEVFDQTKSDEIPPGKIILRAKPNVIGSEPKCLKTVQIKQKNCICVCAKSVSYISEELIDRALQNLYTGMRSLIDRLPFRIQRAPTTNIVLSFDTRSVIGLGLQEIKVQLIPSLFLPINGWFQAVPLYATAFMSTQQDYKVKGPRGGEPVHVPLARSDVIWSLDLNCLEELFLNEIDHKMACSGVHSCHKTCKKVLKVLFTALSRKSLLDRGELNATMIETVVFYLLMESTPDQWTFSQISDRISDACLYLKAALESGRLPNFFINNPHLLKQMPFLQSLPLLLRGKQCNILADARLETVDKKLNYMQDRIRDSGLEDCFNDTYSTDTWEWEFFVFS